jgi:hypothetical protein
MRDIPPADRAKLDLTAVHYAERGAIYRRGLRPIG